MAFTFGQAFANSFNAAKARRAQRMMQRRRLKAQAERLSQQIGARDRRQERSLDAQAALQDDQQAFTATQNEAQRTFQAGQAEAQREATMDRARFDRSTQYGAIDRRGQIQKDLLAMRLGQESQTEAPVPFQPYTPVEEEPLPTPDTLMGRIGESIKEGFLATPMGAGTAELYNEYVASPLKGQKEARVTERLGALESRASDILSPEGRYASRPRARQQGAQVLMQQAGSLAKSIQAFDLTKEQRSRLIGRLQNVSAQLSQLLPTNRTSAVEVANEHLMKLLREGDLDPGQAIDAASAIENP